MKNIYKNTLLAAVFPFLSAAFLSAQDLEREAQKPAEQTTIQAQTEKTAIEAEKKAVAESKDVTYAQILEKPDDLELNYAYAKTQVRKGDLKGAAATLERMLMVNPGLHNIRLFYAVVLYRLDNLAEAQRELEILTKGGAPAAVKTEAETYIKDIKRRQQLTTVSGGLSAGAEYDSNRNAAPSSGQRLFNNTLGDLTGLSKRRDDASFLFMGNAEIRRVVSPRKKHEIFGSLSYFRADQASVKTVTLQATSLKTGGTYKAGRYDIKPALIYDRVLLQSEKFLVNTGGSLRVERKYSKSTDYALEAKYLYEDHMTSEKIASNPERRGALYAVSAGAGRVLTPVMKLNAELSFSDKLAASRYYAYRSVSLALRHSWLLGKGRFLLSSLTLGNDVYRQADAAISRRTRKDATLRVGVTGGMPVANLHHSLSKLKDLTLTLSLEHFHSCSTITNYTYVNNKAALLVNYRWNLGL